MLSRTSLSLALVACALLASPASAKDADAALYNATTLTELQEQLAAGADANVCLSDAGTTILMRIVYAGLDATTVAEMVKALVEAGADVNAQSKYAPGFVGCTEPEGMTALMHACEAYYEDDTLIMGGGAHPVVVKALLDAGANPNLKNVDGYSALSYALFAGSLESVQLLLDAGADAKATLHEGQTYLMLIAAQPHEQRTLPMIPALLEAGVDINAQDALGQTALHHLCNRFEDGGADENVWKNRVLFATSLLQAGAHVAVKDEAGKTPLDLAKESLPDSHELVELLSKASPNAL